MPILVRIQTAPFDVAAETIRLKALPQVGAIVTFTGVCRDEGGRLAALELEHYPGMAEAEITRIAEEAAARWPVAGLTVIHRTGRIAVGDDIVLVAAASSHREAAFAAANYLMDFLKTRAPLLEEGASRRRPKPAPGWPRDPKTTTRRSAGARKQEGPRGVAARPSLYPGQKFLIRRSDRAECLVGRPVQVNRGVDVVDPIRRDEMMLSVGGVAARQLDPVRRPQGDRPCRRGFRRNPRLPCVREFRCSSGFSLSVRSSDLDD